MEQFFILDGILKRVVMRWGWLTMVDTAWARARGGPIKRDLLTTVKVD